MIKKLLFIIFIFVFASYSSEFITNKILTTVEEKYGESAKNRFNSLQKLIIELQNKNEIEIVTKVTDFFNEVSFSFDKDIYGVSDYWATPFEFLARDKGDCEDYAIAKYFVLNHLGITPNKMFITYVYVNGYDTAHMVLSYFQTPTSDPLILDNFHGDLLPASKRPDLKPIYYFSPEVLKNGNQTSAHRKWDQLIKNIKENKL